MAIVDAYSYVDSGQPKVQHLDWFIEPDFETKILKGRATYTLGGAGNGVLDLDTRDLDISRVTGNPNRQLPFQLSQPDPVLGARLRIQLDADTSAVTITYRTSPSASALQWLNPEHTAGGTFPYLFSQCQPIHARSMLPIQDSPIVRFTYSAQVRVPEALSAVMSAASEGEPMATERRKRTFSFRMPQPIPSYLMALAVGNLASRQLGSRSCVFAEPEVLDAAAWEFAHVEEMLKTAESLFGPYLWERFDFVVMPPAFPYGGMENPRLTFLTPTLLAGDRSMVNVLAHELAHSWTGNLVTNATINDFWLNEGFTVWAERRILEELEGRDYADVHAVIGQNGLRQALTQFGHDSPLTRLKTDLSGLDPDLAYSQIPYEKGFLFVKLLQETVGREAFETFIRKYIDAFKFTSITTEAFVAFLKRELPGVYEKIKGNTWIYGAGIPDNAPQISSELLFDVDQKIAAHCAGRRMTRQDTTSWSSEQWQVFLHTLPRPLPLEECRYFDRNFRFARSGNLEIVCGWLCIAAVSGYHPAVEKMEEFVASVGRLKYLKPLYSAMLRHPLTKEPAHRMYAENQKRYHPITKAVLDHLFTP